MEELLEKLKAPFPKEAHSTDSSRGFDLTSIKAQWVVERLNDVFGVFGWEFTPEFEVKDNVVLCHGLLYVREPEASDPELPPRTRKVQQTGGATVKKTLADAYKSAATDSLGKCASWLCIGNDVFKGNVDPRTYELKVSEAIVKAAAPVIEGLKKISEESRKALLAKYEFSRPSDLYKMTVPKLEAIAGEIERVLSLQEIGQILNE